MLQFFWQSTDGNYETSPTKRCFFRRHSETKCGWQEPLSEPILNKVGSSTGAGDCQLLEVLHKDLEADVVSQYRRPTGVLLTPVVGVVVGN